MLKLYSNIKRLRKLNNMSQQELAEAVGYKGKSMIAQVENGKVDLPASMISKFADVFHVSELELMGEDEDILVPKEEAMKTYINNDLVREFWELYEQADPVVRDSVLNILKNSKRGS